MAYGESLGTGVATRLALLRPVKALVLEAPFTSVVDVGRHAELVHRGGLYARLAELQFNISAAAS